MNKLGEWKSWMGMSPAVAAAIVAVCLALGAVQGVLRARYWASASLDVAGTERNPATDRKKETNVIALSYVDVKRFWASAANAPALQNFLDLSKSDPGDRARLLRSAGSDANWRLWIKPVYPLARADAKEFVDLKQMERDQATNLFGVDLRTDGPSEAIAAQTTRVLRDYVVDALVDNNMRDWALAGRFTYETKRSELDADLIKANRRLSETQVRVADLKGILGRYPDAARLEGRQVISVSSAEGTDRFLSPVAQVVAAESAISAQRIGIQNLEREIFQAALYRRFFEKASALFERPALARDRLKAMNGFATEVFSNSSADVRVREAQSIVLATLEGYGGLMQKLSVQAAPWVSGDPFRNPTSGAFLGLLAGLGIVLFWVIVYRAFAQPAPGRN